MVRGKGNWAGRRQGKQGLKKKGGDRNKSGYKKDLTDKERYGGVLQKSKQDYAQQRRKEDNEFDLSYGFHLLQPKEKRIGWLLNMMPATVGTQENLSALELYFLKDDGTTFKGYFVYKPYFYCIVKPGFMKPVRAMFERRFEDAIAKVEQVTKVDLDVPNHLYVSPETDENAKQTAGQDCLKLSFHNVNDLMVVRREVLNAVKKYNARVNISEAYESIEKSANELPDDLMSLCIDIREYDVPYYVRVSIDNDIHVGSWYEVGCRENDGGDEFCEGSVTLEKQEIIEKAQPRVLAFDIECFKQPLKFPVAETDPIFMISYMVDGQGYLIISREYVSQNIQDFEYTPKPEFPGPFEVFNEANEHDLIRRFFDHCKEIRPNIYVTYNGDYFDWPYIEKRAKLLGMDMGKELGVRDNGSGEYRGRCCVHIDCLYWVKRDSYLPAGSRGLKNVTKAKLGYDPVEVDPEDMVRFAKEQPEQMAAYSVSDAVATFYLYDKYINLFIFSLCTIIPMGPDDVLRKGSGTLCEMLLMIEAFKGNILCPNKQVDPPEKFLGDGRLLASETYIGGHVECLESGVYRDDLPNKFSLDPAAFDELIESIDADLSFAIEVENGVPRTSVTNYEEIRSAIVEQLEMLRDSPNRVEEPRIYHLDVAAMYPNIILTNRLQPCAIVDEAACASCAFNDSSNNCKRSLEWVWRGEAFPATKSEYNSLKTQIEYEKIDGELFHQLPSRQRAAELKKRVKTYCQTVYKRVKDTIVEKKQSTVCQRENPFYVNTVKAFRDRRYDYKGLTKKWAKLRKAAAKDGDALAEEQAASKTVLYDSLQLAHKCILNSFYGYVMRRGARWYSMDMAAMVTNLGGNLIKAARQLVERVGRPLELDTDGIWCILPSSFPENFSFTTTSGGKINFAYPCVMLNCMVHDKFTNHQYQDLVRENEYTTHSECSIYFEVDGPYKCMVLPASQEEGKLLKKRYAVFNFNGTFAELKGFEMKRRGELKIVQIFQSQCFPKFLAGDSLEACYDAVGEVANQWLEVLYNKGEDLDDAELIDLISENRSMSKLLSEYGDQKSTAVTTAHRLSDFLGVEMVKDKGLACKLLIAAYPQGASTSQRAIPCAIFSADSATRSHFLRKWTNSNKSELRDVIDWDYYIQRLAACIMKIISIPAELQLVENPVKSIEMPAWVGKMVKDRTGPQQKKITNFFTNSVAKTTTDAFPDIEDLVQSADQEGDSMSVASVGPAQQTTRKRKLSSDEDDNEENIDTSNFSGWLAARKRQWKNMRKQHRSSQRKSKTLSGFLQQSKQRLAKSHWQIIDCRNHGTLVKVMALVQNQMVTFWVETPQDVNDRVKYLVDAIGCVAQRHKGVSDEAGSATNPHQLGDIKRLVSSTNEYLADGYSKMFLYYNGKGNRHLFALFYSEDVAQKRVSCRIWIVSPSDKMTVNPGKLYKALVESSEEDLPEVDINCEKVEYLKSEARCWTSIQTLIKKITSKPTIIVVQACEKFSPLKNLARYPLVFVPFNTREYQIAALQFQPQLATFAVGNYVSSISWWDERVDAARYGHIPIALLGEDYAESMFSTFYSRMLSHNRIKPWKKSPQMLTLESTDTVTPGIYRSVCVELTIGNLAINCIVEFERVLDFEGVHDIFDDGSGKPFNVLRAMVKNWINDVRANQNKFADMLLVNLYRLLVDANSTYYHDKLHSFVERLMQKAWMQLVAEVRRLGGNVVFANKSKLIVNTGKAQLEEAEQFVTYLINQLQEKPIFSLLKLNIENYWKKMIFLDDFNWSGTQQVAAQGEVRDIL